MLFQALTRVRRLVLDQVLPLRCGVCSTYGNLLCEGCVLQLPAAGGPRCARCWQLAADLCSRCEEYGSSCTAIRAPFRHNGGARHLVSQVKYGGVFALADPMAALMADYWRQIGMTASTIMPVPLHPRRQRQRGFNQSALLAERLAYALGLRYDPASLTRRRATMPQARLTHEGARRSNVYGAFECVAAVEPDARILLIDDVTTTGATLGACADVLFEQGAAAVFGLAFTIA